MKLQKSGTFELPKIQKSGTSKGTAVEKIIAKHSLPHGAHDASGAYIAPAGACEKVRGLLVTCNACFNKSKDGMAIDLYRLGVLERVLGKLHRS